MRFDKADKWFSYYIRLKYADKDGIVKCFTCNYRGHWKKDLQNGHGIGRQHKSTRFSELNCHPQCKRCNKFLQGAQAIYKEEVDKKYGVGTWNKLEVQSKGLRKYSQFELDLIEKEYKELANAEAEKKGLTI